MQNRAQDCSPYPKEFGEQTIKFAEDNLCGWIAQPANTWSNLAFLLISALIAYDLKQNRPNARIILWGFVPVYAFLGFASMFYHASATFVGQFLDFGSLYVFVAFILFLSLERLKIIRNSLLLAGLIILTLILLLILWFAPFLRIWLFAAQILLFLYLEFGLARSLQKHHLSSLSPSDTGPKKITRFKNLKIALIIFCVAWFFWWLDILMVWDHAPTMHFMNGHAVWHILSATSLYFTYKFFRDREIVPVFDKGLVGK